MSLAAFSFLSLNNNTTLLNKYRCLGQLQCHSGGGIYALFQRPTIYPAHISLSYIALNMFGRQRALETAASVHTLKINILSFRLFLNILRKHICNTLKVLSLLMIIDNIHDQNIACVFNTMRKLPAKVPSRNDVPLGLS